MTTRMKGWIDSAKIIWADPVFSKVIAQAILGIASVLGLLIVQKTWARIVLLIFVALLAVSIYFKWWRPARTKPTLATRPQKLYESGWFSITLPCLSGLILGIMAALLGIGLLRVPNMEKPPRVDFISNLTDTRYPKFGPSLSDGRFVYFTQQMATGVFSVMRVPHSGGASVAVKLPFRSGALCSLSRNGDTLMVREAKTKYLFDEGPLWLVPINGSPPILLSPRGYDGSWSQGGQQIVYTSSRRIFIASSDGKSSRQLLEVTGEPWWPRWSADDQLITYTLEVAPGQNQIWETRIGAADPHRLLPAWDVSHCCGSWSLDGQHYYFQEERDRTTNIRAVRLVDAYAATPTETPPIFPPGPVSYWGPSVCPDGRHIIARGSLSDSEVIRCEINHPPSVFLDFPVETLSFSRDGKWMAYTELRAGRLWRAHSDGKERTPLTFAGLRTALPAWSPDGSRIAFMGQRDGPPWRIFTMSSDGSFLDELLHEDEDQADPSWSPDGETIVFGRNSAMKATSEQALYLVDIRTRTKERIKGSKGLFSPRWSPDGRYIVAISTSLRGMKLYDTVTNEWKPLTAMDAGFPSWSHDSEHIYFLSYQHERHTIYRVSITKGDAPTLVCDLQDIRQPPTTFGWWIGIAPDASLLAIRDGSTHEVSLLQWATTERE